MVEEDDKLPARQELCHKSPDDVPGDNLVCVGDSKVDIDDYDDDDAYISLPDDNDDSFKPNASPPEAKRMQLVHEEDSLKKLQSKYDQLILKAENFHKSANYWKSCNNQSLQSQVAGLEEAT